MINNQGKKKCILITGGTSGLGLELVKDFLKNGYHVVATGRKNISLKGYEELFTLYLVDFSNLSHVAEVTREICRNHSFSFIVNNAGILSPPAFTQTMDGLEYTFQVNFLAHLLMNEIILKSVMDNREVKIASVTSPVYRLASLNQRLSKASSDYRAMRSYSSSKLYVAMMGEMLAIRHQNLNLQWFSFDPGTFRSGIPRMQEPWFRALYRIAAPFMRNPSRIAKVLAGLLLEDKIENGMVYDCLRRERSLPDLKRSSKDEFIDSCFFLVDKYLKSTI